MEKKCCICGKEFVGYGNNARPIKDGTCCDSCNDKFVIPIRIKTLGLGFIGYEVCRTNEEFNSVVRRLTTNGFINTESINNTFAFYNERTDEKVIVILTKGE